MASGEGRRGRRQDKSRQSARRHDGGRLGATELLELLAREEAPVGWRELVALTHSDDPVARKSLRLLVKGMLRSGELAEDHQGHYHPAAADGRSGVLEGRGRNLLFDGVPVERTRELRLR